MLEEEGTVLLLLQDILYFIIDYSKYLSTSISETA